MFENLHNISLISIEKAPITQPNIYSLEKFNESFRALKKLRPLAHLPAWYDRTIVRCTSLCGEIESVDTFHSV